MSLDNIMDMTDCTLCPRSCRVNRAAGEVGYCKESAELYAARAALYFDEEPVISGHRGSGAVFFSGCNMGCIYCQNYAIAKAMSGTRLEPSRLSEIFLELQEQDAENINLVTPTPHVNGILRALDMARNDGLSLPIVYNTNGYMSVDTVDKLKNHVDIWLPDFKYHDQRLADRFSSAPRYFETALAAIGRMLEVSGQLDLDESGRAKKGVLIRHLVLPACVFDTRDVLSAIKIHFGTDTYLSLMHQFTPQPDGQAPLNRRLTKREYESAVNACLDMGFTRVYIQDALSATFAYTPDFSNEVSVQA